MQGSFSHRPAHWGLVLVALLSFVSARAEASAAAPNVPAEFDTSLRPDDGTSLKLTATGTVYILGRFTTSGGDIRMTAGNNLTIDVPDLDLSGINVFLTADNTVEVGPPGPGVPPIVTLPPIDGGGVIILSGAGSTVVSLGSTQESSGVAPATVTALIANLNCLVFEGDVFLDLSGLTLADLDITAGQDIVWSLVDPTVIPEPGTALLMGLGLTMLGARRGTRS